MTRSTPDLRAAICGSRRRRRRRSRRGGRAEIWNTSHVLVDLDDEFAGGARTRTLVLPRSSASRAASWARIGRVKAAVLPCRSWRCLMRCLAVEELARMASRTGPSGGSGVAVLGDGLENFGGKAEGAEWHRAGDCKAESGYCQNRNAARLRWRLALSCVTFPRNLLRWRWLEMLEIRRNPQIARIARMVWRFRGSQLLSSVSSVQSVVYQLRLLPE